MNQSKPTIEILDTRCCIVGGGPAGMMLGLLLARAGVEVVVLEKHADFFRDFRGDTIHPSSLELMYELGLLEELLRLPHQKLEQISACVNGETVPVADLSSLPTHCKYIAFMPQWDFLNFIAEQAKRYPSFRLNDIANHCNFSKDARNWLKEAQSIRNRWAHAPAGGLPDDVCYRDIDTIERLLQAFGADSDTLDPISQEKKKPLPSFSRW